MAVISGDTLESVWATTLWTLHDRAGEAKRSDGLALVDTVRGSRAARDIKLPPGRGLLTVAAWPPRLRRNRGCSNVLEFDR
jgi:hypothetical protein